MKFNKTLLRRTIANALGALSIFVLLAGCATNKDYKFNLMPTPAVLEDDVHTKLPSPEDVEDAPYKGIPYITDRLPLKEDDLRRGKMKFYGNGRSPLIRVGFGEVEYAGKEKNIDNPHKKKIPLKVTSVEEFGALAEPLPYGFLTDSSVYGDSPPVDEEFAGLINQKLSQSGKKDIYIFVHGFKVVFENPLLVSAELWHVLGYEGAMIAYTWPSTPRGLAYFKDSETAELSGQNLRLTIEYLTKHTDAERIHILGYSSGTRVVIAALHQIALINKHKTKVEVQEEYKVGHVILVASDYDTSQFAVAVANGLLKVPDIMTVYQSKYDEALATSHFLFGHQRLGQTIKKPEDMAPSVRKWVEESDEIYFVNVSDAENIRSGKGHGYFLQSPWVSSDLLLTFKYGLTPEERGLVRSEDLPSWKFPPDYIDRMKAAVEDL